MTEENKTVETPEAKPQVQEFPRAHKFIIGRKMGMTQMFDQAGEVKSVTVIQAGPCTVVGVRTPEKNGYSGVCLGYDNSKVKNMNRAMRGQFEKIKVDPFRHLKEFRLLDVKGCEISQTVTVQSRFSPGDFVDVQGISKGKGFAGGMKRHNFRGGPASHGASDRERAPGSLASRRSLGRVLPGQRMAGHMGNVTVTVEKIEVVKVVPEDNLLLVNGSVPGTDGSIVYIKETSKCLKKRVVLAPKAGKKKDAKAAGAKPAPAAKAKK